MIIIGDAGVRVRPDAQGFPGEAEDQIEGPLRGVAGRMAGIFAAAFAAVQLGGFLKDAIGEASDLSESASKVEVVFGDSAEQVLEFGRNASSALGQSQAQALEAAGTFGNLLRSLGLTEQASATMSTTFVGLASDLASFNNTDPAEALEALRAGLTGETEPLKRYGINLNEAAIQQEAVRLGLSATGKDLDANAKAQAAYSLIMAQSSLAQGDFARTSAGLANQQRIMAAQFVDLKANIGGLFVPVLGQLSGIVTGSVLPSLIGLTSSLPDLGNALGRVTEVFGVGFSDGLGAVNDATADVSGLGFQVLQVAGYLGNLGAIFGEAMADGQAGAQLLADGGLPAIAARAGIVGAEVRDRIGAGFADAQRSAGLLVIGVQNQLPALRDTFSGVFSGIVTAVSPALDGVRSALATAAPQLREAFSGLFDGLGGGEGGGGLAGIVGVVSSVLETIGPLISGYIGRYADLFAAIIPVVTSVITALLPVVQQILGAVGPLLQQLLPIITQVAGAITGVLVSLIGQLGPILPQLVSVLGEVAGIVAGALLQALTALAPVIPVLVQAFGQIAGILAGAVLDVLTAILPVIPELVGVMAQLATLLAGALATALQAIAPVLPQLAAAFATIATVLVGALSAALRAILPVLPTLIGALVQLFTAAVLPLVPILPILANLLATVLSAIAPLIPTVVQIVALLIQLAVAAIVPLMPVISLLANILSVLVQALGVVIQTVVAVVGAFVGFASTVIGTVVGFVSTVIGVFTSLSSTVGGIFSNIFSTIRGVFSSIFGFVSGIVSQIAGAISGAFSGVAGAISGAFSGLGNAASSAFSAVGNAVRGVINGAIGIINSGIGFINRNLIAAANEIPFVNIPNIPNIPRLHSGGEFQSGVSAGEGLALLRDGELVITPEQQRSARIVNPAGGSTGGLATQQPLVVNITENVTVPDAASASEVAALVTQGVVWNLNAGITRRVGSGA